MEAAELHRYKEKFPEQTLCLSDSVLFTPDESMQKLFEGGKGSVFQRVLSWIPSNSHQLQLAGALAIANFARNGKNMP